MSMPLSDELNHKQLYLLEVLVKTVEITDESNTDREKPLFVRVKFLDFPFLEITRKDFLKQKDKEVNTNRLDVSESIDANFADNDTDPSGEQESKVAEDELKAGSAEVTPEDETVPGDPSSFNIVGGTRVRLGPDFEDLIIEAGDEDTQLPVSNILESELPVKDIFGVPIGKIDIFIRLSCYGVTIVNQFQLIGENGEYMFRNDKKDNTLQAQKKRSFIFGKEPFATASILNGLVHPSDVRGLKAIVTTEENTLPIKGAEPNEEQLAPQLNPNGRFKFVTRAGELQGQPPRSFTPQNWAGKMKPETADVIPANIDPEKFASIKALLKDFLTGNNSGLGGQRTCCDDCCDAKGCGIGRPIEIKDDIASLPYTTPYRHPNDEAGNIDKFFFGPFKNRKQVRSEEIEREVSHRVPHSPTYDEPDLIQKILSASITTIPWVWDKVSNAASDIFGAPELIDAETLAWALAILYFKNVLPHDSSHEKNADNKRSDFKKDQNRVVKIPDSLPITNDGVALSKYAYESHKPIDLNGHKGRDDKQCFFANKHEEQKAYPSISKISSSPCQMNEVGNTINSNIGKCNVNSNIDEKVDSSLEMKSDQKNNQLMEKQVEKPFELKPEVLIGTDQSDFEEKMIKVPETPNINRFIVKTQTVKSDSTLTKSTSGKTRKKDSAEIAIKEFKGKLGKKNASKLERKLDSQSTRMRRKYMSIYNYTDGMYPGINVGHRHCTHLSRCVPKSMGWLWNTSDSGDGLK
ncbi:hypothetical protein LSTR_LSTR014857, partial [Laodelphax striatellus]